MTRYQELRRLIDLHQREIFSEREYQMTHKEDATAIRHSNESITHHEQRKQELQAQCTKILNGIQW